MKLVSPGMPLVHPAVGRGARPALDALFHPKSIVVIGASEREGSVGRAVLENLRTFKGAVFAVNPSHASVLERPAYPSIAACPEVADLAITIVPAPAVASVVSECAAAGVPAAIIISAGFHECGGEGAALERDVIAAAGGRVRLLGPNCLGAMVPHHQMNASFAPGMAPAGSVAFISQSGALCSAILDWSQRENVGFSAFVSIGAMADLGWGELITYFGRDPHTESIVCYMESVGDARAFLVAASEVSIRKPIVILKVGQTQAGARAAASHTGALTGSDDVVSAAFEQAGVLRVRTVEDLFDMAEVLAKQPLPKGPRLAIITNAGGPGALAADQAVCCGASLAELSEESMAVLNAALPPQWSHGNPVDLLGAAEARLYGLAAAQVLADPGVDGLLAVLTPQSMTHPEETAVELVKIASETTKPVLASWMGGALVETARTRLNEAGIPTYDYPDAAARAFALMWQHTHQLELLGDSSTLPAPKVDTSAQELGRSVLGQVRAKGRTLLTELEANQILQVYGIPVLATKPARTVQEAVAAARALGFPVALKLWSETITHKAEVGGVRLGLRNATEVRHAWHGIQVAMSARAKAEDFQGVVVQPMAEREGLELILGSSTDPQFGPVILFGAGGSFVEAMGDRALGLPPCNRKFARRLMEKTRIFGALKAKLRREQLSFDQLEEIVMRFSHLVAEQPMIAEMDINPLLVSRHGTLALDARIVLHPATTAPLQFPDMTSAPSVTPTTRP